MSVFHMFCAKIRKNFENNIEFINSDIVSLKNQREIPNISSNESMEESGLEKCGFEFTHGRT